MGIDLTRIGILRHSYKGPYLKGIIKEKPEDFIVEEVWEDKIIEAKHFRGLETKNIEGKEDYVHFTLEKTDWDMNKILKYLANSVGTSKKRFSYAGTKDKVALTAQRLSVWHVSPERLAKVNIGDCYLYDFEPSDKELALGDHIGNRFTIIIRGEWEVSKAKKILNAFSKIKAVPNFFGPQRFGTRLNSHLVGKAMLKGDFEEAVKVYLTDTYNENNIKTREAREWMGKHWGEFKEGLKQYPENMRYELTLLHHLSIHPNDYANALRHLPRGLFKIFVHAYQGFLFNQVVSEAIKQGIEGDASLFGYGVSLSEGKLGKIENKVLKQEGLELEDFRIKSLPEASGKGIKRNMFIPLKGAHILEVTENLAKIQFSLPSGAYASVVLLELLNNGKKKEA